MKKTIIIILAVFSSSVLMAQGTVMDKYFSQFADNDQFTKVSVSSKMFSLFTELETGSDAEEEFLKAISKLKGLKVIVADSISNSATLYKQASADITKAGYDELMSVKDAMENMKFSIKEKGGVIEELIMIVGGKQKFVLLSLYGEIDLKNISKIAKAMRVDGLEKLEKLND
ncbi:MAG: hypothetical protein ACI83W_001202 [Marinoscillum sp.]|jgi:hypothetical protein